MDEPSEHVTFASGAGPDDASRLTMTPPAATHTALQAVSKLPLLIMGAVVALAVLVTVALVATSGTERYSPGTPEAALQDFLQASFDRDTDAVRALLTDDARADCRAAFDRGHVDDPYTDGLRAELEDMSVTGTTATATVRFRQGNSSDPFDNSSWSYEERFVLHDVDGEWRIHRAGWPWALAECTGVFR